MHSRRHFLRRMTLAGLAGVAGWRPQPASAEPPPETKKLRLALSYGICQAPQYVAEPLLKTEGFRPGHIFLAIAMAHVGLDHRRDITLVTRPPAEALPMFEEGNVDAMIVTPPVAQELRAKKIGHVVIDTTKDRAILKSTDLCALEPERAARTTRSRR